MEFRIADTFTDSLTRLTSQEQKAIKSINIYIGSFENSKFSRLVMKVINQLRDEVMQVFNVS